MQARDDRIPVEVERLRRREPSAVARWFEAHADALYSFVFYRVGRSEDLATDIVQDTFLTALEKIDDFEPERGGMSTWLVLLARNVIRRELKHRERHDAYESFWGELDDKLAAAFRDLGSTALPETALERAETVDLVQMTMSHLPDRYRSVLNRHYYREETLREIAGTERISEAGVKSLLHRARQAFKIAFQSLANAMDDGHAHRGVSR